MTFVTGSNEGISEPPEVYLYLFMSTEVLHHSDTAVPSGNGKSGIAFCRLNVRLERGCSENGPIRPEAPI
jgi:hypothetical protein